MAARALLDWGAQNIFFYGDLDDIALDDPTREEWFNTDAAARGNCG